MNQKLLPAPDLRRYVSYWKQPVTIDLDRAMKDWEEIQKVQRFVVEEVLRKMFEG